MGNRYADHVTPLYPQKLALTSPTGGGRSVGIVRSRTEATEFIVASSWLPVLFASAMPGQTNNKVMQLSHYVCLVMYRTFDVDAQIVTQTIKNQTRIYNIVKAVCTSYPAFYIHLRLNFFFFLNKVF